MPVAASVLTGERYGGRPIYFSDVIVRRDSTFRSFLVTLGETHRFFGKVIEAGLHEESIRLVAAGEVDGSAIDSQVLAVAMRDDPDLPRTLRVIEALGPSTIQPVAVSKRVAPDLRIEIQNVLTSLHEDPAVRERLSVGMVDHFVPIEASSYDDIRDMLQLVRPPDSCGCNEGCDLPRLLRDMNGEAEGQTLEGRLGMLG